jgi:hypothetical protein
VPVDIELFGQLLAGQPRRRNIEIPSPAPVRDLVHKIGLDIDQIGLIMIDGVQSNLDDMVQPDSRLCFFPFVDGG